MKFKVYHNDLFISLLNVGAWPKFQYIYLSIDRSSIYLSHFPPSTWRMASYHIYLSIYLSIYLGAWPQFQVLLQLGGRRLHEQTSLRQNCWSLKKVLKSFHWYIFSEKFPPQRNKPGDPGISFESVKFVKFLSIMRTSQCVRPPTYDIYKLY